MTVPLPNFPEWAIPMTKIIPMVSTDDGYDLTQVTWTCFCRHMWNVVPNTDTTKPSSVSLTIEIQSSATVPTQGSTTPTAIPVYVDIDLFIFNERVAIQVAPNKS
jgi:hypothetical protein